MPKHCEHPDSAMFMPDENGLFRCVVSLTPFVDYGDILADVLERTSLYFHDATNFARLKFYDDYEHGLTVEYRAYDARRIILTFKKF